MGSRLKDLRRRDDLILFSIGSHLDYLVDYLFSSLECHSSHYKHAGSSLRTERHLNIVRLQIRKFSAYYSNSRCIHVADSIYAVEGTDNPTKTLKLYKHRDPSETPDPRLRMLSFQLSRILNDLDDPQIP